MESGEGSCVKLQQNLLQPFKKTNATYPSPENYLPSILSPLSQERIRILTDTWLKLLPLCQPPARGQETVCTEQTIEELSQEKNSQVGGMQLIRNPSVIQRSLLRRYTWLVFLNF